MTDKKSDTEKKTSSINQKTDVEQLEIRNKADLSVDDKRFILDSSISVFGPFYTLARGLWLILILFYLLDYVSEYDFDGLIWFVILAGLGYLYFIMWKHGRRWTWNTNKWENFDAFQESEKKWHPWGIVGLILIGLAVIIGFVQGWYGV